LNGNVSTSFQAKAYIVESPLAGEIS